jgi:hypothetical protein
MLTIPQKYRQALLDDLTPHPRNPNNGDIGAIHTSITTNGWYGAVIVQKSSGHIIAGHHRVIAARHAGATRVPIIELDCDDDTALRIMLADNRTAALATTDDDALGSILRDLLDTSGIQGTGYDADDLDDLLTELDTPTNATPTPPPITCPSCGHTFTKNTGHDA